MTVKDAVRPRGHFAVEEDAARAFDQAALKHKGA
jgi:hypothetical protein